MQKFHFKDFMARSSANGQIILLDTLNALGLKVRKGIWLGGGAVRRSCLGQSLDTDLDFFFDSQESFDEFVEQIKAGCIAGNIRIIQKKENEMNSCFRIALMQDIINGENLPREYTIQAIRVQFYADEEAIINSFDFTICQFIYDGEFLYSGEYTFWDVGRKRLAINKMTFPVATMRRMVKYTAQGYYACNGCMASILQGIVENPNLIENRFLYID